MPRCLGGVRWRMGGHLPPGGHREATGREAAGPGRRIATGEGFRNPRRRPDRGPRRRRLSRRRPANTRGANGFESLRSTPCAAHAEWMRPGVVGLRGLSGPMRPGVPLEKRGKRAEPSRQCTCSSRGPLTRACPPPLPQRAWSTGGECAAASQQGTAAAQQSLNCCCPAAPQQSLHFNPFEAWIIAWSVEHGPRRAILPWSLPRHMLDPWSAQRRALLKLFEGLNPE